MGKEGAPLTPTGNPNRTRNIGSMQKLPQQPAQGPAGAHAFGGSTGSLGSLPGQTLGIYANNSIVPQSKFDPDVINKITPSPEQAAALAASDPGPGAAPHPSEPDYGNPPPGPPPPPPQSMDELYEAAIREMLGYNRSTEDIEKVIREQMMGQMGESLNNSRAGMGRAGFGASGSGQALEGDIMRQANLDASGAILDQRRQADLDRLRSMDRGLSNARGERDLAITEKSYELALQMLAQQQGTDVPPPGGGGGGGGGSGGFNPLQPVHDSLTGTFSPQGPPKPAGNPANYLPHTSASEATAAGYRKTSDGMGGGNVWVNDATGDRVWVPDEDSDSSSGVKKNPKKAPM